MKKTTDSTLRKRLSLGRRSTIQLLRQPDLPDDPSLPASRYTRSTALAGRMIARGQFDIRLLTVLAECMEAFEALPDGMKARLAGLRSAQEELTGELEANLWLLQLESSLGGPIRSDEQKLKAMLSCIALTEIVRRGASAGRRPCSSGAASWPQRNSWMADAIQLTSCGEGPLRQVRAFRLLH